MGDWAFQGCTSLKTLDLGTYNSLSVGTQAFKLCGQLSKLTVPGGITFGTSSLKVNEGCTSLACVDVTGLQSANAQMDTIK